MAVTWTQCLAPLFLVALAAISVTAEDRAPVLDDGDNSILVALAKESSQPGVATCATEDCQDNVNLLQKKARNKAGQEPWEAPTSNVFVAAGRQVLMRLGVYDTEVVEKKPADAAEATGVATNSSGDLSAFLSALVINSIMVVGCMFVFSVLRQRYPLIYSNNALEGIAPRVPSDSFLGWWAAATTTTTDEVAKSVCLDSAMLLEFTSLCQSIALHTGVPLMCILGPLHLFFGGWAAGDDYMSYLSMGNVEIGSWLYNVHALAVWFVAISVKTHLYNAQGKFLGMRFAWLRSMPEVRANTLMVEGIEEEYRSDEQLQKFFSKLFTAAKVKSAYVVKDTSALDKLIARTETAKRGLAESEAEWKKQDNDPNRRPYSRLYGDCIDYYSKELEESKKLAQAERERINKESSTVGGVNASSGFVTFTNPSDAYVALRMQYSPDAHMWVVSIPPDPTDVTWSTLQASDDVNTMRKVAGYGLIAALFFSYLPLVIGITNIATKINLGPLQPLWAGFAPTMGLQVMVAFLPTLLILVFNMCIPMNASAWEQHMLQNWYYWFQFVFVILVTSIGGSIFKFAQTLVSSPLAFMLTLAETMPTATHFYMNFIVLQWATHAMNAMRYVQLSKFLAFRVIYDETEARKMSEPEDQDYYGLGSRCARFTINMTIGIVFSTLCPPISVLVWVNFFLCRLIYGYLIPFAETRKADLGGHFWVQQLRHLFVGLLLYCFLMTFVLAARAKNLIPALVAGSSIFYVTWAFARFNHAFCWDNLPFTELCEAPAKDWKTRRNAQVEYRQPTLKSS